MEPEGQGLAGQPQPQQQGGGQGMEQMVAQVIELLKQGASPQQLLEQGVPKQVIEAAIQILQGQQVQAPPNTAATGLAQQGM